MTATRVRRSSSADGDCQPSDGATVTAWELAESPPAPELRGIVRRYVGFVEACATPLRRREVPSGTPVLIVNFGVPLAVGAPERPTTAHRGSFLARVSELPATTSFTGVSAGVQVDLTPFGAQMLCGLPMDELPDPAVGLGELLGAGGELITEELAGAGSWEARFEILDAWILRRVADAAEAPPAIAWAWRALAASAGQARIGELADRAGYSPRRLIDGFRTHVGVAPKTAARILRFQRASGILREGGEPAIARVAAECGYHDQAHMTREFRALAGATPARYAAATLPGHLGIPADL